MISDQDSKFTLVGLALILLFGVWFFAIKDALSPFILSLIIIGFMLPFRQHRSIRVLIALVFTLFMIWLFFYLQDIVSPFLIAFALAYLFDPVVDRLEKLKINRAFSIVVIIFFIVGLLVSFVLFVIPQFAAEVEKLGKTLPSYETFKESIRQNWWGILDRVGLHFERVFQMIESEGPSKTNEILKYFSLSARGLTSGITSIINQLINLILIPFATFYFLRDFDRNMAYIRTKIPDRHKDRAEKIYTRINTILSLYIRGKILVAVIITFITWLALTVFQINFALIIALSTGFLSIIPYIGPILTMVIGGVLGLLNPDPLSADLTVLIILAIIQILDMLIISPKVIGEKIGIHPVLMIFALFVFGKVLGFLGLVIAIPVTAILKVFILEWYEQNFYKKEFLGSDHSVPKPEIDIGESSS